MKTSIKTIAATIALTALMAGPASAATASAKDVRLDLLSSAGPNSNVFVTIDDNVATVTGYFRDEAVKNAAMRAVKSNDGIDRIIDRSFTSN